MPQTPTPTNLNGVPQISTQQLNWLAEAANGFEGEPLTMVLEQTGAIQIYRTKDVPDGAKRLLDVNTPPEHMVRPQAVKLTTPSGEHDILTEQPDADAMFWTASSIEKFVFPYYMAHRLLDDQGWSDLMSAYNGGHLVAILHVAPSKPVKYDDRPAEPFQARITDEKGTVAWKPLSAAATHLAKAKR